MPEILPDHVPSPRTPLVWDGTRYRAVRGHTDGTVQVRGEDQIITLEDTLEVAVVGALAGADGLLTTADVPDNEIWVVTCCAAVNTARATTAFRLMRESGGTWYQFGGETRAIAQDEWVHWHGHEYCKGDDQLYYYSIGGANLDACEFHITGHIMTLEA